MEPRLLGARLPEGWGGGASPARVVAPSVLQLAGAQEQDESGGLCGGGAGGRQIGGGGVWVGQ